MDSKRHDRISTLFAAALDLPVTERRSFLQKECGDDTGLFHEVIDLLNRDEKTAVIDQPILNQDVSQKLFTNVANEATQIPREIGPYEIIDVLGRGGMGTVYRARQRQPSRTVALKVVHAPLFSRALARRIEYEAQVLARLQHVGIAQIFEAGAAKSGGVTLPFFALELVDGMPLTDHANEYKLSVDERLQLIVRVCSAVQHAHQQGVIHRDLKPANVLVTKGGQPKVLDFGIARVTDSDIQATTLQTDAGQLVGTIAYMSPEQVAGDSNAIDTRSDVYALGVLTFEVLTGELPHALGGKTIAEAARIIRDDNPRILSSFHAAYRGDLETILRKAMEKDRERRYGSAAEFAADIKRLLGNEPIVARPASLAYQLRKFTQRNRSLVSSIIAGFVLLIFAIVGTSYGLIQATSERDQAIRAKQELEVAKKLIEAEKIRATRERDEAVLARQKLEVANAATELEKKKLTAINTFLGRMMRAPDPMGDGGNEREVTVVEVLDREVGSIREAFKGQPAIESGIRTTMGNTYAGLGRFKEAEAQLRIALDKHRESGGEDSDDALRAERDLASVLALQGKHDEAISLMQSSLKKLGENQERDDVAFGVALARMGFALGEQKKYEESERLIRRALPILEDAKESHRHVYAAATNNLAKALNKLGRTAEAEKLYVKAHDAFVEIHGPDHTSVALTMNNVARMRHLNGDLEGAAEGYLGALKIMRKSLDANHPTLATIIHNVGMIYHELGKYQESVDLLSEALEIVRNKFGENHAEYFAAQNTLAYAMFSLGQFKESADRYRMVADYRREEFGPEDQRTLISEMHWAGSIARAGDIATGEETMRRTLEQLKADSGVEAVYTQTALCIWVEHLVTLERIDECKPFRKLLSRKYARSARLLDRTADKF
ncbi:MAG: serine/threonine protein kinase [Planctomycetes bacterium]|nr:serine/threonine protein kinase [Planctomycetota bacterium]